MVQVNTLAASSGILDVGCGDKFRRQVQGHPRRRPLGHLHNSRTRSTSTGPVCTASLTRGQAGGEPPTPSTPPTLRPGRLLPVQLPRDVVRDLAAIAGGSFPDRSTVTGGHGGPPILHGRWDQAFDVPRPCRADLDVPLAKVSAVAGHGRQSTTERFYVHPVRPVVDAHMAPMQALFGDDGGRAPAAPVNNKGP